MSKNIIETETYAKKKTELHKKIVTFSCHLLPSCVQKMVLNKKDFAKNIRQFQIRPNVGLIFDVFGLFCALFVTVALQDCRK